MNPSDCYRSKPIPVRPGSQEAFTKPSLVGDKRVPYRPPSQGCVGVLKDNKPHSNHL